MQAGDRQELRPTGAVADGFFGERGLLADTVGDLGGVALVKTNDRQVFGAANDIECAQRFPGLVVAGVDAGECGAGGHTTADGRGE